MSLRMLCLALLLVVSGRLWRVVRFAPPPEGDSAKPSEKQERKVEPATTKIELKTVKYDALTAAIREQRGKVVMVDIWASWCKPCKEAFPHLVELHQKYAKDGLVCMSVSVDDTEAGHAAAVKFLTGVKAAFSNYRIDEPDTVWQTKWGITAVPAVFVFDRQGRRAGKFTKDDPDAQFSYPKDVVPLVRKLVAAK